MDGMDGDGKPPREDPWTEVLAAWAATIALVWAAYRWLPEAAAPFAAVALWAGVPAALHLARGRDLAAQGLGWRSIGRTIKLVANYAAVFLPLYAAGFFLAHGVEGWEMPTPDVPIFGFVGGLFFAALPEEIFFRGFVQPRLAALYPGPPRRVLGIPLGRPIALAAALFALTHVAFVPDPWSAAGALLVLDRLLTFFPGLLFGALREETGDVVAPALFHALCNAWLETLQQGYLP